MLGTFIQIVVASIMAFCGYKFLKGSETMRKTLEVSSYLLCVAIVFFGMKTSFEFETWYPVVSMTLYLTPLGFIIWGLRGKKVRSYSQGLNHK